MNITKEAEELFRKMLDENHLDLVYISLEDNGDDASIHVELISKDEVKDTPVVQFGNLSVAISEDDQHALEDIVFNAENDDIVIEIPHHHHHDGECCCGHHHEHEDGHCCCEDHEEGEEHHCCCCEE